MIITFSDAIFNILFFAGYQAKDLSYARQVVHRWVTSPASYIFLFSFKFYSFIHSCACARIEVRGQHSEVGSLFPHVGPGDGAQVVRVGGKCVYPLSQLTGSIFLYYFIIFETY